MMKRKYIKGFLCRDAGPFIPNTIYWFFEKEPRWNSRMGWWFGARLSSRFQVWDDEKFKEEYDCNFELPEEGEKVECWIEVGDE